MNIIIPNMLIDIKKRDDVLANNKGIKTDNFASLFATLNIDTLRNINTKDTEIEINYAYTELFSQELGIQYPAEANTDCPFKEADQRASLIAKIQITLYASTQFLAENRTKPKQSDPKEKFFSHTTQAFSTYRESNYIK